ncbi:MAG: terpene cyclase/mutase family protein [Verrucomicrobia bacterium]|nr:terpene cyclase/mutase family protein [Verrucomicrobiota bacterium]
MDKKALIRTIKDHLWGPTGSIILHVLLVIALVKFVVFDSVMKESEVEVMIMEPEAVDLEELEEIKELLEDIEMPEVEMPDTFDEAMPEDVESFQDEAIDDFSALDIASDVNSPLIMKNLYAGRSASGRSASLKRYAGKYGKFTEPAVIKALEWLKKTQEANGSWPAGGHQNRVGLTGLALLTFLAHGETVDSPDYGETVTKAIRYLVDQQNGRGDGFFCEMKNGPASYAHAIAAYAICEAFSMTRIPELKDVMEKATAGIINGQQATGLWDYGYKKEGRRDLSVAGWNIQALKSAYIAGSEQISLTNAIYKSVEGMKNMQTDDGRFFYSMTDGNGSGAKESMTGVAVLCLQLLGHGGDQAARTGLQVLDAAECDYQKQEWQAMHHFPCYNWYYITQAKFHKGKATWDAWNRQFAPEIVKNQNPEGYWTKPDDKGSQVTEEKIYATTLCALTLQVYYRFLPTYQPIVIEEDTPDDDEIVIEII